MGLSDMVGSLVGAGFVAFGGFALWRPDSVRRYFRDQQPFEWSRKAYDRPGMNLLFRVFGVLFLAAGSVALWEVLFGNNA
jgi:hypothetical protein